MATQKQLDANRRNAKKSTGPRTEQGKLRSRMNSLQHGLGAVHISLPHEDPTEYHVARASLIETWQPANTQELMLVDCIAAAWIRMGRASRFEASMVDAQIKTIRYRHGRDETPRPAEDDEGAIIAMGDPENLQAWTLLARYETRAGAAYHRAIDQLRKVQNDRFNRPAKEMRTQEAREKYLKRTVANPSWQPKVPVNLTDSSKLASFGQTPQAAPELDSDSRRN
jgi:hypothetical protein